MMKISKRVTSNILAALSGLLIGGCSGGSADNPGTGSASNSGASTNSVAESGNAADPADDASPSVPAYAPIRLPGAGSADSGLTSSGGENGSTAVSTEPPKIDDIIAGLKPIQIVLGDWTGIVQKASSSEGHAWVWDLKSDPNFPALVLDAKDGQFFTKARLTFDPRDQKYRMTTTDRENVERQFEGAFAEAPQDVPNENGKGTYRTFKLLLSEVTQPVLDTRFEFVFNQQNNNRYLVEIGRARGTAPIRRFDTIGTQREGVAFAQADDDYGDRTCVISGGLGTSTVSYKGKSYFVCCSGCKAAFDDDPERWIARFEAEKKKKAGMQQ